MDRSHGIATVGFLGAAGLGAYAHNRYAAALKWGESADTLRGAADFALTEADRSEQGGWHLLFDTSHWARQAHEIEFGYKNMSGKSGPNRFQMPAVGPLRRASKMSIGDGVHELRTAASAATKLETGSLRSSKMVLIAGGSVAALTGVAWLGSKWLEG